MVDSKKKISKIKSNLVGRQLSIAKIAIKAGRKIYKNKNLQFKDRIASGFGDHIEHIVNELSLMKGPLMKGGQLLATFGNSFLPDEVIRILKSLESKTHFLEWDKIKNQVPVNTLNSLDIDKNPIAAASLGQVHLASTKNETYVLKIQYKGVKKAIKNDMKVLRFFISILDILPKELDLNELYQEIEDMLYAETDYKLEVTTTKKYKNLLKPFTVFHVPEVIEDYCSDNVICLEYLKGITIHDLDHSNLTQEDRNYLGREFLRLLFLEIFVFELVQSDVHMGNFIILPGPRWGLIDFGATKNPPKEFLMGYQKLLLACVYQDKEMFFHHLYEMNYLSSDKVSNENFFWDYAKVLGSPFQEDYYDWGESNIADKILELAPRLFSEISVGNPPKHSVFLDRKISGVFFVLQKLRARVDCMSVLNEVLQVAKGEV